MNNEYDVVSSSLEFDMVFYSIPPPFEKRSTLLEQPAFQQYFELKVVDHFKFVREKRRSRD
jgi:hypothetical protein